jgi:Stage II sporulation protein E (SpoIIE)
MRRPLAAAAVAACGLLAGAGPALTAAALGSPGAPASASAGRSGSLSIPLPVPTVTSLLPSVSISVPSVTVPPVTTPSVTVGPVSTPQVTTPGVTTPSVQVSAGNGAPVKTTAGGTSPGSSPPSGSTPGHGSGSSSGSSGPSGGSKASQTPGGSGSRGASSSRPVRGSGRRGGHRHRTAAGAAPRAAAVAGGAAGGGSAPGRSGRSSGSGRRVQGGPSGPVASSTRSGPLERLVDVLPTAAVIALLGFGLIAAVMALNAYLQARRARSLAGQRAALLSDVGVLQAALLPAVPDGLGELDVTVAYRPAQGLAAGGDFFDVFALSGERTGIIIGDVSGHGRESLIRAALVRYTLRTLMGEGHSLPEVLARADRYLTGELGDGFATVVVCCYDHATGQLTWAKAGHEPPLIAGQPDSEEEPATALGFGLGDTWPQFARGLAPGDRVCLFTDGLTEARHAGEQLGRAHLRALVEQGLTAQALLDRIQSDSDECTDDLAAVVIHLAAPAAAEQRGEARVTANV